MTDTSEHTTTFFRLPVMPVDALDEGRTTAAELREAFDRPADGTMLLHHDQLRWLVRFDSDARFARMPHHASYTLTGGDLVRCLRHYNRRLVPGDTPAALVTVVALPPKREMKTRSLQFFARRVWAERLGGTIRIAYHATLPTKDKLRLREAISRIGAAHFEEARDALDSEALLFDRDDDHEVLGELLALYARLRTFHPARLRALLPGWRGEFSALDDELDALDLDTDAFLAESRPDGAPTIEAIQQSAAAALHVADARSSNVFEPKHRLEQLLGQPELASHIDDPARALQINVLARGAVDRLIQPGGRLGRFDFEALRDLAIKQRIDVGYRPLRDLDRALGRAFPEQHRTASIPQRILLGLRWWRRDGDVGRARENPKRQRATESALVGLDALLTSRRSTSAPLFLIRWLWYCLWHWVLFGWFFERIARLFELSSVLGMRVADGFRRRRFKRLVDGSRVAASQNHLARAMTLLRLAQRELDAVYRRYPGEAGERAHARIVEAFRAHVVPFTEHLAGHLGLADEQRQDLTDQVDYLVDQVARHGHGPAADLLLELEGSYLEGERPVQDWNIGGWIKSFGKEPATIDLPHVELIKRLRHLERATRKVEQLPLPRDLLEPRARTIEEVRRRASDDLEAHLAPAVEASVDALRAATPAARESHGLELMRRELLQLLVTRGYSTFSDVRDVISRNQLKLDDYGLGDLARGDMLYRLDRELGERLPGIHRTGEAYLKLFHFLAALSFGTLPGRVVSRAIVAPGAIAALLLAVVQSVAQAFDVHASLLTHYPLLAATTFTLGILLNTQRIRRALLRVLWNYPRALWRGLVRVLKVIPTGLYNWLVYPTLAGGALALLLHAWTLPALAKLTHVTLVGMPYYVRTLLVSCFVMAQLCINSRFGVVLGGWLADIGARLIQMLGRGLLLGLFRLIVRLSRGVIQGLDWLNYHVVDALRLLKGEPKPATLLKGVASLAWSPVYYFIRLYVMMFLEPQVNPLKFPIVSVSYKVMFPFYPKMNTKITAALALLLPSKVAGGISGVFVFFFSGIFGFFAWELKENWRLYRRNASKTLDPVIVGSHGETLAQLLRPGFHSGPLPALYRRRREAMASAAAGSVAAQARLRALQRERQHIVHDISVFAEGSLVLPLARHPLFADDEIELGEVAVGPNTIQIELHLSLLHLRLDFDERAGVLAVRMTCVQGDLDDLTMERRMVLALVLASFYKLGDVDVIRNWIERELVRDHPAYSLDDAGAKRRLIYEIEPKKLHLYFVDQTQRSTMSKVRDLLRRSGTQEKTLALKSPQWLREHRLEWVTFDALYEPDGHTAGLTYLPLLGELGAPPKAPTHATHIDAVSPSPPPEDTR